MNQKENVMKRFQFSRWNINRKDKKASRTGRKTDKVWTAHYFVQLRSILIQVVEEGIGKYSKKIVAGRWEEFVKGERQVDKCCQMKTISKTIFLFYLLLFLRLDFLIYLKNKVFIFEIDVKIYILNIYTRKMVFSCQFTCGNFTHK